MSNFDAGKIIEKRLEEHSILKRDSYVTLFRGLTRELNAKHREVDSETVKVWDKLLRQAVADEKEKWINRITGIYILLERANTYAGHDEEEVFKALRRVEAWVNKSLPEGDRR